MVTFIENSLTVKIVSATEASDGHWLLATGTEGWTEAGSPITVTYSVKEAAFRTGEHWIEGWANVQGGDGAPPWAVPPKHKGPWFGKNQPLPPGRCICPGGQWILTNNPTSFAFAAIAGGVFIVGAEFTCTTAMIRAKVDLEVLGIGGWIQMTGGFITSAGLARGIERAPAFSGTYWGGTLGGGVGLPWTDKIGLPGLGVGGSVLVLASGKKEIDLWGMEAGVYFDPNTGKPLVGIGAGGAVAPYANVTFKRCLPA
jgi:hypothetical protein